MALIPGDNQAVRIEPRVTIESGANPQILPPPDPFEGILDGGTVLVDVEDDSILVFTAPYLGSAGTSLNASRLVEYAALLAATTFVTDEGGTAFPRPAYPDVVLGGTDTTLNAVSDPHLTLLDYDSALSGVAGGGPPRWRAAGAVPTGMEAGWMEFQLTDGDGNPDTLTGSTRLVTTLTMRLEASQVRSFTTGPAAEKRGRIAVTAVQARGTGFERLFSGDESLLLSRVPRRGELIVRGDVVVSNLEPQDLDGSWILDGRTWRMVEGEIRDVNEAQVVLRTSPRTRA